MLEHLERRFPLNDPRLEQYAPYFKKIELPAKHVLLQEGQVSRKMYWVEKGCIRVWFNNHGKDITFQFFFENSAVGSIESFRKNIPSYVTIETIEPCVLWYADKRDVQKIIADICEVPELREYFIDAVFERTFDYMRHFLSSIRDTPSERYQQLLRDTPHIIRRVPQHYIASYLGITTVHLSRIKSRLAKGGRL